MAMELVKSASNSVEVTARDFMPIFQIDQAIERRNAMVSFVKQIMVENTDFGTIPGTPKPSLFKAGAEKLCTFFGLSPQFILQECIEDWNGTDHRGESFFYYRYKCRLERSGRVIGEGEGSGNSWESKYRYRWIQEDQIPDGLDRQKLIKKGGGISEPDFAINKGETSGKYGKPAEYWQRFRDAIKSGSARQVEKTTSAGKKMMAWEISSTVYRVPNPDVADVVNTIQKMAQKRALVAATLIGVNASEYFTQDIEDMQPLDNPTRVDNGESGPVAGSQQAADAVADRKLAEMKNGGKYDAPLDPEWIPPTDDGTWPDPVEQTKKTPTSRDIKAWQPEILKKFANAKKVIGEPEYYRILKAHGFEKSNLIDQRAVAITILNDMAKSVPAKDADPNASIPTFAGEWPDHFDGPSLVWNGERYDFDDDAGNYRPVKK